VFIAVKEAMTDITGPPISPSTRQAVFFPSDTGDYRLSNIPSKGLGLVATRHIAKARLIFDDSLEYSFTDVIEGDTILFDNNEHASKRSKTSIPQYLPLTRHMLLQTHGVPTLTPDPTGVTAGTISWRLEVPGMFMNHACVDPNCVDFPPCAERGEGYASRDIHKGQELTCDYVLQYYDEGPFFEACLCGSLNCRGSMMGFKALSPTDQEKLLPTASQAVQAMYKADRGEGLPVKKEQVVFPERTASLNKRLVFPGPSHALAQVDVKQENGTVALYALEDYSFGEQVYEYWCQPWPKISNQVDLVMASPITEGDPPEGTILSLNALEWAPLSRQGQFLFSGWELFTQHSCDPNLVYDHDDEDENWRCAYAAKDIKVGDKLTVDYNCLLWDRGDDERACPCGNNKCTGTVDGFKHLSKEAQEERKVMSWRRLPPPYNGEDEKVTLGEALSPYVLDCWRKDPEQKMNAPRARSWCC